MFWAAARAASTPILATTRTDSGGARGLGYEAAGGSWDTQVPELKAYNPTLFQRIRSWWTMDPELGIGGNLPMHEDMIHSAKNTLIRPLADPVIAVVQDPSVVPRAVGNAGRLAYSAVSAPRQTLTDVETAWRDTHPLVLQRQLVSTVFAGAVSTSLGASRVAAASSIPKYANEVSTGGYLAGEAPRQVAPGTRVLTGQYIESTGVAPRVQPGTAYYADFGRLIGRTDYNAANPAAGIPDIHFHTWEYNKQFPLGRQNPIHFRGEFQP